MMTIYILLLPLLASLIALAAGNKFASRLALFFSAAELLLTVYAYLIFTKEGYAPFAIQHAWISSPSISINLGVDGLSLLMVMLTNLVSPLIILSAFNRNIENASRYFALILFMQFAMLGVFMSFDGLLYYIFWELALIPIYFIALNWGGKNRVAVTLKFFIYTLAGSLLMLVGFIYLYWKNPNHTFNWHELSALTNVCSCDQSWLFWLIFIAFAIKIPIVPFHTWQADTYSESPTQGTMLLSGIMLKMGIYSLFRWLLPIVPAGVAQWGPLALTLCIIGVVYASVIAIMQGDLKRLLAYSSLSHVGLIAAGVFVLNSSGMQGAAVQMLAHAINVVGLFYCADIIINRTGTSNLYLLGGIRNVAPRFNTLFMIVVLGSVALPLTNAFIGEFLLLFGVYTYNTWLAVFAGLTIILGAVYMLRMFQITMLGNTSEHTAQFNDLSINESIALGTIAILIFVTGIYPKPIIELVQPTLEVILNKALIK